MNKRVEVIEPGIVLDWYDGPLLEIALVVFTPGRRSNDKSLNTIDDNATDVNAADAVDHKLVQLKTRLCSIEGEYPWERATLRLSRDNLQAMLDLIDGKPVTDCHGDVIRPLVREDSPACGLDSFDPLNWTGPLEGDLKSNGVSLSGPLPPERWPYGPPTAHEDSCRLRRMTDSECIDGFYCDCAASAADDLDYGIQP